MEIILSQILVKLLTALLSLQLAVAPDATQEMRDQAMASSTQAMAEVQVILNANQTPLPGTPTNYTLNTNTCPVRFDENGNCPTPDPVQPEILGSVTPRLTPVTIDKANPTTEMVEYFYEEANLNCPQNGILLPNININVNCVMTSDGSTNYPRGTNSKFINAVGQTVPLDWLKERKLIFGTSDEFKSIYKRYSCGSFVQMTDNGSLIWGGESENPYNSCKTFIAEFDASHSF